MITLIRHQFRAQFGGLIIWVGASLALTLMLTRTAPSVVAEGGMLPLMESMPESLRRILGVLDGLSPLDGYVAAKIVQSVQMEVALYTVLVALSIVTREVDRRTIDYLLALPVSRDQVLLSRVVVMAINSLIMSGAIWALMRIDLAASGLTGSWGSYALMMLNIWLLAMALGGVTLLASLWIDDYSLGVKLVLGIVATSFFLEFILKAADLSRWARAYSPFSYLDAAEILRRGALPWPDMLVLVAVALVTIGLAFPAFHRKQIVA